MNIIKVRPAPHRRLGYATFCPSGSFAALAYDPSINQYQLILYHDKTKTTSIALDYRMEEIIDHTQPIVDFNFGQSNGLSLLCTLTVHLLKASGQVMAASPVLWENAVVPASVFDESMEYLNHLLQTQHNDTPKYRQARAATFALHEAFTRNGDTCTCYLNSGNLESPISGWELQIQGPIVPSDPGLNTAAAIEPFFSRDLVGIAIGHVNNQTIDLAVLPCSAILPRYTLEDSQDQLALDSLIQELGCLVEKVQVQQPASTCALLRDPVLENMLHYVSETGVMSVTSNSLKHFSSQVRESNLMSPVTNKKPPPSKAWMSVTVPKDSDITIKGAAVSCDALLGHSLVVFLSNGLVSTVNLTQTRYRYEATLANDTAARFQDKDEAYKNMQATPAFHEEIRPIIEEIETGLRGMTKWVGSSTNTKDIKPGEVAAVIELRDHLENNLMVHLKHLNKLRYNRMVMLRKMCQSQYAQAKEIYKTVEALRARKKQASAKVESIESKARTQAELSSRLLQEAKDIRPALTKADIEYFNLLERTRNQCQTWEKGLAELQLNTDLMAEQIESGRMEANISMSPFAMERCRTILDSNAKTIKENELQMQETAAVISDLVGNSGVVIDKAIFDNAYDSGQ